MSEPNGKNAPLTAKLFWWALGIVGVAGGSGLTATFSSVYQSAQRVAVLEAQQRQIERTLDRIEKRLDEVLEKRP